MQVIKKYKNRKLYVSKENYINLNDLTKKIINGEQFKVVDAANNNQDITFNTVQSLLAKKENAANLNIIMQRLQDIQNGSN